MSLLNKLVYNYIQDDINQLNAELESLKGKSKSKTKRNKIQKLLDRRSSELEQIENNPDQNSHELFIKLLDSDSDIIRLYSIWALWRIGMLDKVNEESFIKKEVSSDVKKEFERLKK